MASQVALLALAFALAAFTGIKGSIKALLRLYSGSIQALFIQALFRLCPLRRHAVGDADVC